MTQRLMSDEHACRQARTALAEQLAGMDDADAIDAVTTALIETGANVDIPQAALGIVEIQLYGIAAHGGDLGAACLAWVRAVRDHMNSSHAEEGSMT